MPLKSGKKNMGSNIAELIKSYQKKGKIGTSTPKDEKAAQRQAIAISYRKAGE